MKNEMLYLKWVLSAAENVKNILNNSEKRLLRVIRSWSVDIGGRSRTSVASQNVRVAHFVAEDQNRSVSLFSFKFNFNFKLKYRRKWRRIRGRDGLSRCLKLKFAFSSNVF